MNGTRLKNILNLNFKNGEKVKVSPLGDVVGLDGRTFKIDGQSLIDNILKNDIHIPMDENHYFGEAVGWFDKNSFEIRGDGLYASLELNQKGQELIDTKAYRYMSPVFIMGGDNSVFELDSVGLVNRPNLLNKELNQIKIKELTLEELEQVKADLATVKEELKALKEGKPAVEPELNPIVEENSKQEIEALKETVKELNSKMATMFKKVDLEQNDKVVVLSENEKKVADLLGIPHAEYLSQKVGA